MKSHSPRRPRPFGPATRIAVVGVIAVLGYSVVTRPSDTGAPDLQAVRQRIANEVPPPPLRKPEVAELLASPDLTLTAAQRNRIERVDSQWRAAKDALQKAMQGFAVEGRSTEVRLRTDLQDYSTLSRQYDAVRKGFWQEARLVLTDDQRRVVDARQGVSR